jgi:hypothetical protein
MMKRTASAASSAVLLSGMLCAAIILTGQARADDEETFIESRGPTICARLDANGSSLKSFDDVHLWVLTHVDITGDVDNGVRDIMTKSITKFCPAYMTPYRDWIYARYVANTPHG